MIAYRPLVFVLVNVSRSMLMNAREDIAWRKLLTKSPLHYIVLMLP